MSESLFEVSSNPGVSMRVTDRPSNSKVWANWTVLVQDSSPPPTRRFEPLARFMNYRRPLYQLLLSSTGMSSPLFFRFLLLPWHWWFMIRVCQRWFVINCGFGSRNIHIVIVDDGRLLFNPKSDLRINIGSLRRAHLLGRRGRISRWSWGIRRWKYNCHRYYNTYSVWLSRIMGGKC